MNIAVALPAPSAGGSDSLGKFIVETSFFLIREHLDHKFIIITDTRRPADPIYSNIETIFVKPPSKSALLKKIWWDIRLPALLKKAKADLFISFQDACSVRTSIVQVLFIRDIEKAKKTHVRKAQLLLVPNDWMKRKLIENHSVPEKKITIMYPAANKIFEPINEEEKAATKNKYAGGKEFFLFNSIFPGQQAFIDLLKSFSHFKKRQQSNFKLLLTTPVNSFFEKSLAGYKYRSDVKFNELTDEAEAALITASAYAVVLPFNTNENLIAALNTMRSGVPVIALKKSAIHEVAKDAALYAETETTKDVGEKMIQAYTNEKYRFKLIEKGKQVAAAYTNEQGAEILWQCILKVLE